MGGLHNIFLFIIIIHVITFFLLIFQHILKKLYFFHNFLGRNFVKEFFMSGSIIISGELDRPVIDSNADYSIIYVFRKGR